MVVRTPPTEHGNAPTNSTAETFCSACLTSRGRPALHAAMPHQGSSEPIVQESTLEFAGLYPNGGIDLRRVRQDSIVDT
ncbi:hypothetical protein SAMN05661093_09487 [Kibdelosporangium aridum]|uniref:Uncharacterized protein n=1 Tax=Kibdelosporangium aridum TaxID=2030 RepID=A0A1Y5Y893_KIBAR|nr:hypothetical protein SAMN05661093_09487 [Kibdelosporangium aridum]